MEEVTHKGWFGICPVFVGDKDSEAPLLVVRHPAFKPLFHMSLWIYDVCFFVMESIDPEFEGLWPIRITGEINKECNTNG